VLRLPAVNPPALDIDALEASAATTTGRSDFGTPSYRDGLEMLVRSLNEEAQLSEIGYAALEAQIVGMLANRLRVVAWRRDHPEVADQRVTAPLVVIGLPRTGTTLLSALLGCDTGRRPLMRWESSDCIPPPETATFTTDPRIEATRAGMQMLDALNPDFKAIHYDPADGPTECVTLLAQHFVSTLWETLANVPAYGEWLLAVDETDAYSYHHDVLQVLQSRAPGRWSLKSPHHGLAVKELRAQYPDARVVVTHRDPVTVVASVCSLIQSLSGTFSDADHTAYIASHWPNVADEIVTRIAEFRDGNGDDGFFDVQYPDLMADPIAVVRDIYEWEGTEFTPAAEKAMREYMADHAQDKFGRHTYSLERFGLDATELRERFEPYVDRFDVR
jgi:Sulfotransferase family